MLFSLFKKIVFLSISMRIPYNLLCRDLCLRILTFWSACFTFPRIPLPLTFVLHTLTLPISFFVTMLLLSPRVVFYRHTDHYGSPIARLFDGCTPHNVLRILDLKYQYILWQKLICRPIHQRWLSFGNKNGQRRWKMRHQRREIAKFLFYLRNDQERAATRRQLCRR